MLWLSNLYYDFDEVTLRYGHLEKLASWLASRQVQMATYIASWMNWKNLQVYRPNSNNDVVDNFINFNMRDSFKRQTASLLAMASSLF